MGSQSLRSFGTAGYVNLSHMLGDFPIRYFQLGEYPAADELSGVDMAEKYLRRNTACHKCVIACGRETFAPAYQDEKVDGPEYEASGALGSLLMIFDLQAVIHANHLCNLYGMDVISLGVTIGLACELFERGLLTAADTGGLEIRYGDAEMVFQLIELTARREGFGAVLAEGNAALAERAGVPELSATVNRLEVPMHDPRAYIGMAVTYALSPRGACHMQGNMYDLDLGQSSMEEVGLVPGDRHENSAEKGRMAARLQAWRNLYNSLTLCEFENPTVSVLLKAVNAATGWNLAADDLMTHRQGHRQHQASAELQAGPDARKRSPARAAAQAAGEGRLRRRRAGHAHAAERRLRRIRLGPRDRASRRGVSPDEDQGRQGLGDPVLSSGQTGRESHDRRGQS